MERRPGIVHRQRASRERPVKPLKIVITGPFAAGKTTLIQTISEVAIVGTERNVTDDTASMKRRTTVAMDFGRLSFAEDLSLFLFGTPGQRRFEVMWEILSEGMIGFIVLVNAADDRSAEEAAAILDTFREYADVPYVVGVTHLDETDISADEAFSRVRGMLELPEHVQVKACDARVKDDAKDLILKILVEVMERLDRAEAAAV